LTVLLEVIVQSVADAIAAADGGADRLEVVRDLDRDGLTPPIDLVRAIAEAVDVPLRVMVRESDGFSIAGPQELTALQDHVAALASLGVDGVVAGFTRDGALDLALTRQVLSAAPAMRATFHRAFDAVADPLTAIDELLTLSNVDRVLTSGGGGNWNARCQALKKLASRSEPRVTVLAGGGIDADGIDAIASSRCVREVHVGRAARKGSLNGAPVSAELVRRLKASLENSHP
jgi:copper homeostasis protein